MDRTVYFGPPLFPPTFGIYALDTVGELHEHWEVQKNCLMTLRVAFVQREKYAYRLTHPKRATVVLAYLPESDNRALETIAGPHNRPLGRPEETDAYVRSWIVACGGLP